MGLEESSRNQGEEEAKGGGRSTFHSEDVTSTTRKVPPKSIRTNAQLLKGRSRVRVGDIFDIISKGYS